MTDSGRRPAGACGLILALLVSLLALMFVVMVNMEAKIEEDDLLYELKSLNSDLTEFKTDMSEVLFILEELAATGYRRRSYVSAGEGV